MRALSGPASGSRSASVGGVRADTERVIALALECGFDLAGVARAEPLPEFEFFEDWVRRGRAASMTYLTDHRAGVRRDPRNLLPGAKSILMGGVLYHTDAPLSTEMRDASRGWISRYAWGARDYHDVLRERFQKLVPLLPPCEYRICVDTAPLLERAYARRAGLGWIGKNTCLINEPRGSWFFLGAMLLSLELEQPEAPPPDRCGSCTRCIDACPTQAIVPTGRAAPAWELDSAKCISYHTIESREEIPEPLRPAHGNHVFGCDICQDVCPWNSRAPVTDDPSFQPVHFAPLLDELAALSGEDFRAQFRGTPVWRAKHRGLVRNVEMARGNSGKIKACRP